MLRVKFPDDRNCAQRVIRTTACHNSWITCVEFIAKLGCVVTTSLDRRIVLSDLNSGKRLRTFDKHKYVYSRDEMMRETEPDSAGVYQFVYSNAWGFIASAGVARSALVWNPITLEVIQTLSGHKTAIQNVLLDDRNNNLITISMDKCMIIWNCEGFNCKQHIFDFTLYGVDNRFTAAMWDGALDRLVTANKALTAWPLQRV